MAITQRGGCIEPSGFAFKQCGLCCIAEASVAEQSAFRQGCLCCIAEASVAEAIVAEASVAEASVAVLNIEASVAEAIRCIAKANKRRHCRFSGPCHGN